MAGAEHRPPSDAVTNPMRLFVAGLFTETNTFAPWPTDLAAFEAMGIRRSDGTGVSPPFEPATTLLGQLSHRDGSTIVLGLLAIALLGAWSPTRLRADVADNAGGGATRDSTFVLGALIERGIDEVVVGRCGIPSRSPDARPRAWERRFA